MKSYPISRGHAVDELIALACIVDFLAQAGQQLILSNIATEDEALGFYYTAQLCTEGLRRVADSEQGDFDKG